MPEFQGQSQSTRAAAERAAADRPKLAESNLAAVAASNARYQEELQARGG